VARGSWCRTSREETRMGTGSSWRWTALKGGLAGAAPTSLQWVPPTALPRPKVERPKGARGVDEVKRAKAVQLLDQDLKEAISDLKKDEYRRGLEGAHDLVAMGVIEGKIRMDSQLTMTDRMLLLSEVECATELAGGPS